MCSKIGLSKAITIEYLASYIPNIAFKTLYDNYGFFVMLFMLKNILTTFMELMNKAFQDYLDLFVIVSINDFLMYSFNKEDHGNT